MYLTKEKHSCLKLQHLAASFPVGIELLFEGNIPGNHSFFKVEKGSFCSKQAYSADLKKHMQFSKEIHPC
jgi:hypothetical protein